MARARRQHVVSRFYLNGFASDRGLLRRVALPGDVTHLVSVNDATVIKDFYSIELGGELDDYFEQQFARVERRAADAMRLALAGSEWPLPPRDKAALASWIALQHLRAESVRTGQQQIRADTIRLLVGASGKKALRGHIEAAEGAPISEARLDAEWTDFVKPGGPTLEPDAADHLRTVVEMHVPTAEMLRAMQWSLDIFERRSLITCDHPVVLLPNEDHPRWMGLGIFNAGGFAIALSRRRALVIGSSPDLPDLRLPGTTNMARSINSHIARNARHSIYHHPDDAHVVAELTLPDRRTREFESSGDGLIREEGLFAGLSESQLKAFSGISGGDGKGFTLSDLPWPVPGRVFSWTEQPAADGDG